jgi:hypothetical protein
MSPTQTTIYHCVIHGSQKLRRRIYEESTHVTYLLGDGNSYSRNPIISCVHLHKLHGFRTELSDMCAQLEYVAVLWRNNFQIFIIQFIFHDKYQLQLTVPHTHSSYTPKRTFTRPWPVSPIQGRPKGVTRVTQSQYIRDAKLRVMKLKNTWSTTYTQYVNLLYTHTHTHTQHTPTYKVLHVIRTGNTSFHMYAIQQRYAKSGPRSTSGPFNASRNLISETLNKKMWNSTGNYFIRIRKNSIQLHSALLTIQHTFRTTV